MAKIKFNKKELRRLRFILDKELKTSQANKANIQKQEFSKPERKKKYIELVEEEIQFLELLKEKVEIELFGK